MPIYKIQAPDGKVYRIQGPEGASPEDLFQTLAEQNPMAAMTTEELEAAPRAPTSLGDVGRTFAGSLVGGAKTIADVFGAGSEASKFFGEAQQDIQKGMSKARQEEIARRQELMERASQSGSLWKEAKAYLGAVGEAPLQSTVQGIGSSAPSILAGIALLPLEAPAAVGIGVATIAKLATGAAQGVGEYKGSVYDAVKAEYIKNGYDEKDAAVLAEKAQQYTIDKALEIGGSGFLGALDALTGVESGATKAIKRGMLPSGEISKAGISEAIKQLPKKAVEAPRYGGSVLRSMLGEAPVEGLQGGFGQYAQNLALQKEGFDQQAGEGVLGTALHDALVGALTGAAFTPGEHANRTAEFKLDQYLRAQKGQMDFEAERDAFMKKRAEERARVEEGLGMKGEKLLALPAPDEKYTPEPADKDLINPVGNITRDELNPEVVRYIDKYRKDAGLPRLKTFSIEDVKDAMTSVNPQGEKAALDSILAAKTGFTGQEKYTPDDVINAAVEKNVAVETKGFADFLQRTTGERDLSNMSQPQLFSAFKALKDMSRPETGEQLVLPEGTNASRFTDKQYNKAIKFVGQSFAETGNKPLSTETIVSDIKEATGLENDRDAKALLDMAVKNEDLSTSSEVVYRTVDPETGEVKFTYRDKAQAEAAAKKQKLDVKEATLTQIAPKQEQAPKERAKLPGGFEIERGTTKTGETPAAYEIAPEGRTKPLATVLEENEVQDKIERLQGLRRKEADKLLTDVTKHEDTVKKGRAALESMEARGLVDTEAFKKAQAQQARAEDILGRRIKALLDRIEEMSAPLTSKPVGKKAQTKEGHVLYKDGERIGSFPSRAAAEEHILSNMSDKELEKLTTDTKFGAFNDRAMKEMIRRKELAQGQRKPGIEVKGTKEGLEAAGVHTQEVQEKIKALEEKLIPMLKKFGLGDVGLKIVRALENGAEGSYKDQLIKLVIDEEDPVGVLRHESIHALKDLGFFTPQQWAVLEKRAKDEWIDKYLGGQMAVLKGETMTRLEAYKQLGYSQSEIIEEAIADAFRAFKAGDKPPAGMIASIFNRLGQFFQALKQALGAAKIESAEEIFGKIEEGKLVSGIQDVGREDEKLSLKRENPLEKYVSEEDAKARIGRRAKRAPGVGSPGNARTVIGRGKNKLIVGKITPADWVERVKSRMSDEEIKDARNWYQSLHDALEPLFGDDAPKYALAWLLSQQRASPTKGFTDVMRAADMAAGKQKVKIAGLNEQALIDVLQGKIPASGVGAKLMDFVDSELGKTTRTYMKDIPAGRQPAAIDVWAQRDIGFIDETVMNFLKKEFGADAVKGLGVDKTTTGEAQYEYGIDFYNNVAEMLNRKKYMGGGWTAAQVQALGWVTMQRAMGVQAEFVRDIIGGNTRRISIGLAAGEGSPMSNVLAGKEIPLKSAQNVIKKFADIAGLKVVQNVEGVGAYLSYVEGSIQLDSVASPEAVQDFMDMVGYAFQQTEIINTRALASGKNMAIDVMSPALASNEDQVVFFREFLKASPKDKSGDPIAPGFQPIVVDGVPGIRLLNFSGNWRQKQVGQITDALNKAAAETEKQLTDIVQSQVVLSSTKNDWKVNKNGKSYLDSLRDRGRLQEAELLQREFPPSRFDIAGDDTVSWGEGGERYSLRSAQTALRPGESSGVVLGKKQAGAASFTGVHYGNVKTDLLSADKYGTGLRGAERRRLEDSDDERIKRRVYFYIAKPDGSMPVIESGVGSNVYSQTFRNILAPGKEMSRLYNEAHQNPNFFESAIVDAGYDGYAVPNMGMMVILNHDVPVDLEGTRAELSERDGKLSLKTHFPTAEDAENAAYEKAPPETKEFKQWFGASRIMEEGRPQVMYHASPEDFSMFRENKPIFVSPSAKEAEYFGKRHRELNKMDVNVYPLWVRAETPFDYENENHLARLAMYFGDDDVLMEEIADGNWDAIESPEVQDALMGLGHDSFYVNEAGSKNLAVYNANQVKSVTGNIGEFGENKDIRFSLPSFSKDLDGRVSETTTAREEKGFAQRITEAISPTAREYFRQKAINRYERLGRLDKLRAEKMGGAALLADQSAESAALMSDLAAGVTASALGYGDRHGGIPVFRKGMTTIDRSVKGLVASLAPLAKYGDPKIYRYYQFWAGVKRGMRLLADGREENFEAGDIEFAKELEAKFPEFKDVKNDLVAFNNGIVQYQIDTGVLSKEQGAEYTKYADYIPFYRQLDGETTIGPNIYQSIGGVKPPKKLKGGEAPLADFLETLVRNTQAAIQAGMKNEAALRAVKVATDVNVAEKLDHAAQGPDVIKVREKGKDTYYRTHDHLLIDAISSLHMPELPFMGILSAPSNALRNLVTKDPGFMLANLMRDSLSAYVTTGQKMTPIAGTLQNFTKILAKKSPAYEALLDAGVIGGYEFSQNVEASGHALQKDLSRKAGNKGPTLLRPFTWVWEGLEKGTEASDAATRALVYERVLKETGNEAEALYRALEVMNFNRKGNSPVVRILTAAVPFLNARVQGLDLFYRASTGQMNMDNAKQIQRAFIVRGLTMMALSAMYYFAVSDSDDYKKQEQETKDNNWIIPGVGIRIPTPFEVGVLFKTIPERILAYSFKDDTGQDLKEAMYRAALSTFAFNPTPQAIKPVLEATTNFNFFTWRPIVGQGMEGVAPEFQVGPGTSKGAEMIGKELGLSPLKVDHVIRGYTGTMGTYAVDLLDAIMSAEGDSPKATKRFEQMPVLKRFLVDPDAKGTVTSYYELKGAVDTAVRTMNLLEKSAKPEEFANYVQENIGLIANRDYISSMEKDMKQFREMRKTINSSSMSGDEKRDVLTAISQAENNLTANIQTVKKAIASVQ